MQYRIIVKQTALYRALLEADNATQARQLAEEQLENETIRLEEWQQILESEVSSVWKVGQ